MLPPSSRVELHLLYKGHEASDAVASENERERTRVNGSEWERTNESEREGTSKLKTGFFFAHFLAVCVLRGDRSLFFFRYRTDLKKYLKIMRNVSVSHTRNVW